MSHDHLWSAEVWHVLTRDHTVLPDTHTFIHKWNKLHLSLLPGRRASPHFGWYLFPVTLRVGGWVGIWTLLIQITNRKRYMAYRTVAIPMTWSDLQDHETGFLNAIFRTLCSRWQYFNWHSASRRHLYRWASRSGVLDKFVGAYTLVSNFFSITKIIKIGSFFTELFKK